MPKGRLQEQLLSFFSSKGYDFTFEKRKLIAASAESSLQAFLVKNSDMPTYVHHGIAGMGVCGSDVLYESGYKFFKLYTFPFGETTMCLAGKKGGRPNTEEDRSLRVATKFPRFTRDFFHDRGIAVQVIKLNGSVELAPLLGLAPYIVDLVETGSTIRANNLEIIEELCKIDVYLIANPAYYKLYYRKINELLSILKGE